MLNHKLKLKSQYFYIYCISWHVQFAYLQFCKGTVNVLKGNNIIEGHQTGFSEFHVSLRSFIRPLISTFIVSPFRIESCTESGASMTVVVYETSSSI